jgi:hypothetical protein
VENGREQIANQIFKHEGVENNPVSLDLNRVLSSEVLVHLPNHVTVRYPTTAFTPKAFNRTAAQRQKSKAK